MNFKPLPRSIATDYRKGMTLRQIAAQNGVSPSCVAERLASWGYKRRRPGFAYDYEMPPLDPTALELYLRGHPIHILAPAYGISDAVFRKRLRILGIEPRGHAEARKVSKALRERGEELSPEIQARAAMFRSGLA